MGNLTAALLPSSSQDTQNYHYNRNKNGIENADERTNKNILTFFRQ